MASCTRIDNRRAVAAVGHALAERFHEGRSLAKRTSAGLRTRVHKKLVDLGPMQQRLQPYVEFLDDAIDIVVLTMTDLIRFACECLTPLF